MINKNNFKKKTALLLFFSVLSCSTYAMESLNLKSEIKSSLSDENRKSNIKKLFEDISKEKKVAKQSEKNPYYYNEIGLKDFLRCYSKPEEGLTENEKLETLGSLVEKLYSEVDKWCNLNIENMENLSENIYKLIEIQRRMVLDWYVTHEKDKTDEFKINLTKNSKLTLDSDKNKSIWCYIKSHKKFKLLNPEGHNNSHILHFGLNKPSKKLEKFKIGLISNLRATVIFNVAPCTRTKYLIDKGVFSDSTEYYVTLRHEKDESGKEIRLKPYEIKLSFHYGEYDKSGSEGYIVRDLKKFLEN